METSEEFFLEHFGKKGMKWGVRNSGGPKTADDHAKIDSKEYYHAQRATGTGSVKRRRAIKQTVDEKSHQMPGYSTAFHKHLGNRERNVKVAKEALTGAAIIGGLALLSKGAPHPVSTTSGFKLTPETFKKVQNDYINAHRTKDAVARQYRNNPSSFNEANLRRAVANANRAASTSKAFEAEAIKRIEQLKKVQKVGPSNLPRINLGTFK